jgi:cytochrome c2
MFFAGILVHKHKPLPYRQAVSVYRTIGASLYPERFFTVADLAKYYSLDRDVVPLSRTVDTALLPVEVNGIRLTEKLAVPKIGGAITAIGDDILIMDRVGNFYLQPPGGDVRKLELPPLPNNIAKFLDTGAEPASARLRASGVRYLSRAQMLVVSHEAFEPETNASRMVVSRIGFDGKEFTHTGSWKTVFKGGLDGGGALAVDDQENILLTVGDYRVPDERHTMPDGTSNFGKIFKINPVTGESRTISTGHRNPQGILITEEGQIFSTEHGPAGGDELNLIVEGKNYGWPDVSFGTDYGSLNWDKQEVGRHEKFEAPLFAWMPSAAISDLIKIKGFHERWDGDLLVGSLKGQSLYRLRLHGTRVMYAELIYIGQRIRSLTQLSNGTIVLWTDGSQLLSITPLEQRLEERPTAALHAGLHSACMYCHHFGPTNPNSAAPTLSGLFERPIASDNYRYTPALREKTGKWTESTLRAFLLDPPGFASGTSMPQLDIVPEAIDEIVEVLKQVSAVSP